jgi:hypothetical protein
MPKFCYHAIMTKWSANNLHTLLDTLYPTPAGVLVGAGFDARVVEEVRMTLTSWNDSNSRGQKVNFKVVAVPLGTLQSEGADGIVKVMREGLAREFGVQWED